MAESLQAVWFKSRPARPGLVNARLPRPAMATTLALLFKINYAPFATHILPSDSTTRCHLDDWP
jgi:hypothetical protein